MQQDDLIDVWKIEFEGSFCYTDRKLDLEDLEGSETVTKEKMLKKDFEALPEFDGF